jgi:hypothetical protein
MLDFGWERNFQRFSFQQEKAAVASARRGGGGPTRDDGANSTHENQ